MTTAGLGWPVAALPRVQPRVRLPWYPPSCAQYTWLGHHPGLLGAWVALAGPAEFLQWAMASLHHRDIEVVVLRTCWNSGGYYHWAYHLFWSRVRGKRADFRAAMKLGPDAAYWSVREATLLRAVDELHDDLRISAGTLNALRAYFNERELIEVCFIAGHYELLAMTFESIGLPYDGWRPEPSTTGMPLPRRRRQPSVALSPVPPPMSPVPPPSASDGLPVRAWYPRSPTGSAILSSHPNLGRLLRLFARNSVRFAQLAPRDQELAVLRTLWTAGAVDEWSHRRAIAHQAGVDDSDVERITQGPDAPGWQPWEATLLRAVDELDSDCFVSDETWPVLAGVLDPPQLIELSYLVGHYRTLAMVMNSLEPASPASEPVRARRAARRRTPAL